MRIHRLTAGTACSAALSCAGSPKPGYAPVCSTGAVTSAPITEADLRHSLVLIADDNGTYFQTVPFWTAIVDSKSHLRMASGTL